MAIDYTDEKRFTQDQVHELFALVGWESAQYPTASSALIGSSTVISAWDGNQLAGLARVIDDGEMLAYMHWVLVNPKYQGMHVGSGLVERVKERYADYMFLEVMPEESKNTPFYRRHGFTLMEDGRAMQIVTHS
ncbi:acetyltransferase [Bifidobacterium animalis subsp. lactis ATCC 27673]|uniref:GNAT family N-acetyltransferase n=1 Tax=Bifidobacterium animalis TaxID=28025 RepID=UPI0003B02C47|nr:GNAT family N-acetyltransferase [Bifidobacterium animalis]AGW84255.1 acetyltransferase [Bifidobacterium animalis subsp. lactis ATCC 27673]UBZ01498.1 GNAT family N-acetyltransferase [Bifidobacterium animalis subsp. lactis]